VCAVCTLRTPAAIFVAIGLPLELCVRPICSNCKYVIVIILLTSKLETELQLRDKYWPFFVGSRTKTTAFLYNFTATAQRSLPRPNSN